ncbi:MAG: O-antigen ligase family protein [Flaviramulus sp.]|nr:O-antigen ligase family protein [Flaviramulus sp.]NNC50723.1 O-antigen ligase family protein [Flaviramulus sp.]
MNLIRLFSFSTILNISFYLFGVFPILPEKLKGLPVILIIIISLASFFFGNNGNQKRINYKPLIGLTSLYTILFLSIFYTLSFSFPKNKIETTLSLLLVPFAFVLIGRESINKSSSLNFFKAFIGSTFVLSFYSFLRYYEAGIFIIDDLKVNSFRRTVTEMPFINDHPIYISIYLGLSVIISIPLILNEKISLKLKGIIFIACFINCIHLLLLSSKGVILALLFSLISLFYFKINLFKFKILVITSIISIFILSIFFIPTTERRFREFVKKTTYTELRPDNSSSVRVAIYYCVFSIIRENPIIGYGWGVGIEKLNECYKQKSDYLHNKKYNSHNQYMSYYIDGGLLALFVLVLFIFNQFKKALSKSNHSFFSILLFFSIIMLFENILERQSGLIVFIFLICFYRFKKVINNKTAVIN